MDCFVYLSLFFLFASDSSISAENRSGIDFVKLFEWFKEVQKNHQEYRGSQRKRIFESSNH